MDVDMDDLPCVNVVDPKSWSEAGVDVLVAFIPFIPCIPVNYFFIFQIPEWGETKSRR
jgi:hypothetical protein